MKFFKIAISLILSIILQSFSLYVEAQSIPPYYTKTIVYANPDQYCFSQGEWSGDLSQTTLKYQLIVPPEDQAKYGDIFLGFRRKSAPDKLWLFGFSINQTGSVTKADWVQYDQKQAPVVYKIGQALLAATTIHILDKPMNLTQFEGDGEVLVGYGLRKNEHTTSPTDSFKDMLDNNRFISIWQVDSQQPVGFGRWTCLKFTEMIQRVEGFDPTKQ